MALDVDLVRQSVDHRWNDVLPVLEEYISIPAKSPAFDPGWQSSGHLARAVELVSDWCARHAPMGADVVVHEIDGRTPVITIDVASTSSADRTDTVLLYGHLDKQPEMVGWREGLGPWTPVVEGDRLYGRGGADDGYSAFAALAALEAVAAAGGHHSRCVVLIEASEESGSVDLPAHLELLDDFLGDVTLVVCLDSGAPDYEALWTTTSLRGMVQAELRVDVLERGMHSGIIGGVAPSSFRILRRLLDRVEDSETGRMLVDALHVDIPEGRLAEATAAAAAGVDMRLEAPFNGATRSDATDPFEAIINACWRPAMATVAIGGVPGLAEGGNVLRPFTTAGLSFRLPPTCSPDEAIAALERVLTADPPNGASVAFTVKESAAGWNASATAPWLQDALDDASSAYFGRASGAWGLGASIPFMAMLGQRYPEAQFVITGALGPESNAHGPNEFLHLPTARAISGCVAQILDAHAE
jgi:acetylornithine deacetylase/succinyl-diaminopimelate desuccinylase-like protein